VRRTLAACALPALAISVSWLRIENPRRNGEALAIVALALAPALFPHVWQRVLALGTAAAGATWIAFGAQPWELLPYRDERVVAHVAEAVYRGVGDYYSVVLPFDPASHAEMHALVLVAVFGFVAATAFLVASRRAVSPAALTVAGVGWPATLVSDDAVAIGALALAAALSVSIVLRVRSAPALAVGAVALGLVVAGAAWASSATTFAREAALDWQGWDFRGLPASALGVRFVWDANYDGVSFPPTETVVLEVAGPEQARYWRASTLDLFTADRWFEELFPVLVGKASGTLPVDALVPPQARNRERWLEQRIDVKALVDDRIVGAGTPRAIDAPSLGTVFFLSGGVVRARRSIDGGTRYRVWSYAPDPSPAALASAPARYPGAARRFLSVWGKSLPPLGTANRDVNVQALLADSGYPAFGAYRPLYEEARRLTRAATTPYAAVLALESWFRQRGGFRYDEQPLPAIDLPPLVHFVTVTRAGYCQHYAGAMAVMLRLLGIPSRVAVGFTSGTYSDGVWTVTDHDAHAWVEVWFPGHGWVAFDPTPGRGTFAGIYSFASENAAAVAALGRGELAEASRARGRGAGGESEVVSGARGNDPPSLVALSLLIAAMGGGALGVGKAVLRRARYLTRDPRRAATASRLELEAFLRDQGIAVPASATLDDLRRAVGEELGLDGRSFAEAAGRARFGPPHAARRDADAARQEVRALLRRMRAELSVWARLRGFVSLRSLRGGWQS